MGCGPVRLVGVRMLAIGLGSMGVLDLVRVVKRGLIIERARLASRFVDWGS